MITMIIIARSKTHLFINSDGWLLSVMLNHSEATIADKFGSLPFYENMTLVGEAFPDLH